MIMPLCAIFFGFLYLMYKYQLLYVYINSYQSGGYMWYAVFDRSMLALMCGVITLVCYLAIRQTYLSGPFYAMFPLPVIIALFWQHCNAKFKGPARVRILRLLLKYLNTNVCLVVHLIESVVGTSHRN